LKKYKHIGTFVSNGVANGRLVWLGPKNVLYHFSDGGTRMVVSEKAIIKYDDLNDEAKYSKN
jgi:hypothetical protein